VRDDGELKTIDTDSDTDTGSIVFLESMDTPAMFASGQSFKALAQAHRLLSLGRTGQWRTALCICSKEETVSEVRSYENALGFESNSVIIH
jgi:hypothetical protein